MSLRIVFMGTPDFAVPSLKALVAAGHDVVGRGVPTGQAARAFGQACAVRGQGCGA